MRTADSLPHHDVLREPVVRAGGATRQHSPTRSKNSPPRIGITRREPLGFL